jgi:hypothetical protein
MSEQLDQQTFTGPHPSTHEFMDQLLAWGFTRRRDEGVHVVMRGPHGGTIRLLRSLAGRADAGLVDKAARLAGISIEQFWTASEHQDIPVTPADQARSSATQDRLTSLVLAAHIKADRPLGFEEVVDLCGGRATRSQVVTVSSALCRDGDLDRIRSGVYQWSGGHRAAKPAPTQDPTRNPRVLTPAVTTAQTTSKHERTPSAELFAQLFPAGVQMTAELFSDFERWTQLTDKLADRARAS